MKSRCYNKNRHSYRHYGGRGIKVCDRWLNDFWAFVKDMGDRPKDHSLDRINNDGNYDPSNCKWSTQTEQVRNTRVQKNNTTGVRGVCKRSNGKYRVRITVNGNRMHIGDYETFPLAVKARNESERQYWQKVKTQIELSNQQNIK